MPYFGKHSLDQKFKETGPRSKWSRGKWVVLILVGIFSGGLMGGAGIFLYFSRGLPSIEGIREYKPSLVTKVYGDDRQLIGQYYVERRVLVPLDQMPPDLIRAIIAVEDSRFYTHRGIDPVGILRAFITNIESLKIRQGASTITQQLARSLFLTPDRNLQRKIREAMLALKMERMLTKDEILELYLNQIYLGHGSYGVQAAAKLYFGKDISELNLAEVAYLAGVPRAPNEYSPYRNPERAKRRQGVVLSRMKNERFISEEQFQETYSQDLYFQKLEKEKEIATYFLESVRLYLAKAYGDTMVYKGGLSVYTTLNPAMQKAANSAMERGLRALDKRQGYRGPVSRKKLKKMVSAHEVVIDVPVDAGLMSVLDIQKGDIIEAEVTAVDEKGATVKAGGRIGGISPKGMAWAKTRLLGRDLLKDIHKNPGAKPTDILSVGDVVKVKYHRRDRKTGRAVFSLEQEPIVEGALVALDPRTGAIKAMVGGFDFKRSEFNRALSARRQPGSAFKPMIYATALDRGFTPASIVIDAPIVYVDEEQQKIWKPRNYASKFYGPISLREALTHSKNLATVKLLNRVGINNVLAFSKRMGVRSPLTPDLSLGLGSSGVGLTELTSAYGVFANEGVRVEPVMVLSVVASDGSVLEEHEPTANEVLSKETAYLITNMLEDVVQRGTGRRARVLGRALAGKTGTTNDFTDAWFMGYVSNLSTGVWVGFDDNRSLGEREAGAAAALPIWINFMRPSLKLLPKIPFQIPDRIVFAKIDPKTGLLAPEGSEGAVVEIFAERTRPKKISRFRPKPADFFRIDIAD